jgi:hypothetical protein
MASTVEQQYTNGRGKDGGILLDNTNNKNSMTRTSPAELMDRWCNQRQKPFLPNQVRNRLDIISVTTKTRKIG